MQARGIIAPRAKEFLKKGEYRLAILELSASLEEILFVKMFFQYDKKINSMDTWTLGKYVKELKNLKSINKTRLKTLDRFVELRNIIVHSRNALDIILINPESKKSLVELLRNVYKVAVQMRAIYSKRINMESEKTYADYISIQRIKIEYLFLKLN